MSSEGVPARGQAVRRALGCGIALWLAPTLGLAGQDVPAALASRIEAIRAEYGVPGLAVSVVAGDEIVFEGGFGVTSVGGGGAVDAGTLFSIASASKTFTASAIATLVARGEADWDDRVVDHLPWFRLADDYAGTHATLRDLLSHRTGLARGDRIAQGGFERREVVRRLRDEPFAHGFREGFAYSNVLYDALALVVEEHSGMSWEQFVQSELLDRVGMERTRFYGEDLLADENLAKPHVVVDYLGPHLQEVGFEDSTNYAPAGGIYSSAHDMALWMLANLAALRGEGEPPLPFGAEQAALMQSPQTVIPQGGYLGMVYPDASVLAYGLGWFVSEYGGEKVVFHAGGGAGIAALVVLVPARGLGVVVLANNGWPVKDVVANTLLDHLLGRSPHDWSAVLADYRRTPEEIVGYYEELASQRVEGTSPSVPLESYAGLYEHPVYGAARVELVDGQLVLRWGKILADLEHWHYDTFAAYHRSRRIGFDTVTFAFDSSGRPAELTILDVDGYRRTEDTSQHD